MNLKLIWPLSILASGCTSTSLVAVPCPKPPPIPVELNLPAQSPPLLKQLNQLLGLSDPPLISTSKPVDGTPPDSTH
jgi:hypothetical protein